MTLLAYILGFTCLILTGLSLLRRPNWWSRVFDFPRIQLSIVSFLVIILLLLTGDELTSYDYVLIAALIVLVGYHSFKIVRYTPFFKKQVPTCRLKHSDNTIKLISLNVFIENRQAQRCIDEVQAKNPDVILFLEVDAWWELRLNSLKNKYPFHISYPLENTYGMMLFSKYKLKDTQVHFLVNQEVPSIEAQIQLSESTNIVLFCVHPVPPTPAGLIDNTSDSSVQRDAELILIAKKVATLTKPVIVMGDLNDVAWSRTTRLFQKISQLYDPRIGRGFYNTFHAKYPFLRFPLDHIFHSKHFTLKSIQTLNNVGSDHFPIFAELCLMEDVKLSKPAALEITQANESLAQEKIHRVNKE